MTTTYINVDPNEEEFLGGIFRLPMDERQRAFVESEHTIQYWVGARLAGKTYAVCAGAVEQCVNYPGTAAVLLAPTYTQSLYTLLHQTGQFILPNELAEWSPWRRRWEFKNGSTLLVYYATPGSVEDCWKFAGAAFQYIGIDQVEKHSAYVPNVRLVDYLACRLRRSKGSETPVRMRCVGE